MQNLLYKSHNIKIHFGLQTHQPNSSPLKRHKPTHEQSMWSQFLYYYCLMNDFIYCLYDILSHCSNSTGQTIIWETLNYQRREKL